MRPPGLSDRSECGPGGLADRLHDDVDPLRQPRAAGERLVRRRASSASVALGLVAAGHPHPVARPRGRAGPARWRRRRRPPGRGSVVAGLHARTVSNSIRYAVRHAVGRQAASLEGQRRRLGHAGCRFGTATFSASVPWCKREQRALRVQGSRRPTSRARRRQACTTTSLPPSSSPAPSQPRIIGRRSAGSPTPRRLPQVVLVERGGLDGDRGPAGRTAAGSGRSPVSSPLSGFVGIGTGGGRRRT